MPATPATDSVPDLDALQEQLQHVLNHLYEPDLLAEHPLVYVLGLAESLNRPRALRDTLLRSIEEMKPEPGTLPDSPSWQSYHILTQRFVRCIAPEVLAQRLNMSSRNLRRLQARAIGLLAEVVLQCCRDATSKHSNTTQENAHAVDEELEWLRNSTSGAASLPAILSEVLPLLQPTAAERDVVITNLIPLDTPSVAVHPSGLRQVVLSLINHAVARSKGGQVELGVSVMPHHLTLVVCATCPEMAGQPSCPPDPLRVARHIVEISGGALEATPATADGFCYRASMPRAGTTLVLAIDDNADALQLYERYVAGTRYRLVAVSDPEKALALASDLGPSVIVMDIMMPGLDGWALLGQFRHHPSTAHIPIIVSTIVAEENLALSLGSAAFVRKPVTRAALLTALDAQV